MPWYQWVSIFILCSHARFSPDLPEIDSANDNDVFAFVTVSGQSIFLLFFLFSFGFFWGERRRGGGIGITSMFAEII